jgi:glycosyltransferase involved in cell wall biosynthesis
VDVAVGYPLGADLVRSAPIRDQRKVAKGRGCRIGYLGRISPEKGVDVLIEAAALMEPIARLIVGGDTSGRYAAELRHTANGAGVDVEWLGVVTPADLAGRVDVAVVPSLWPEPFGRVAVELAGLGVHTVVTPVGGLPETAEIFPGRIHIATGTSPRDLADAVRDVLVDGMLEDRLRPALRGRPLSLVDAVVTSIASNVTSGSEALEVGDVRDEGSKEHG